jgi:phosphoribosylformimino-5-aminoimidazole carboxamide ribotide isomerase
MQGRVMDLYPSIDLRDGRVVRLEQGDFARETVYDEDAVTVARRYEAAGARWIHVVDLDAARTGTAANLGIVESVCAAVECNVQASGGVRSAEDAGARLAAGAARVVIGTAAVERPELVDELGATHPGRIAVGLDAHGRDVAVRGWEQSTGLDLIDLVGRFAASPVSALVVTDIGRDGVFAGPDIEGLTRVLAATTVPLIASGGVGGLEDLLALRALTVDGRTLAGAIVGRALYEGRLDIEEAVAACSQPA